MNYNSPVGVDRTDSVTDSGTTTPLSLKTTHGLARQPESRDAQHGGAADEALNGESDIARSGKRRLIIISAAVLLVLLVVAAYFLGSDDSVTLAEGADAADNQIPAVSTIVPGRSTVQGRITASGTLSARRPIPVGSVGEGGAVQTVLVDEGDWVRQGQVLAVIDRSVQSRQLQAQSAQVAVNQSDLQLAQSNLDRALQLVDRGFISQADVDRLTATRDAARARVRVAEAQTGELRARNARLNIVAPAAGLVLERSVDPGQVVGAGTQLFTLAKGGEMQLSAQISEADLSRISVGANAAVQPVGTDRSFVGQVWQIAPTIDEQSRQGTARIALSYDEALRPGGFATTTLQSGTVSAPVLPESAIQSDANGSFVFVVNPDDRVVRRPIKTGLVTSDGIVIASGLAGNERVVLRAGGFLSEGDQVTSRPARAD
ncbi:efflux RND transporter periplasmic adaptor subunit [Croceicoccus sp. F390]|uniref:Efflux RND transporter periplasmic adaptor subunit n=1 Tax=Croceicoccus esteveae TaxID=3075597 RepID=A0ABU2ZES4_9SPHN|nr:efflux RND transporter periplasmic adaptor subunit [Croceicoccus sp. F390]MDT0574861.1 efflux RND transporter periplasmic adaptor subunit [Croceicoccus sp. F390]